MKKCFGALFLDRDGIIIKMVYYNLSRSYDSAQSKEDVELVPGIEKIIGWANSHHITVIEISNQPGVAKGKMDWKTSSAIEQKTHELLQLKGVKINASYICYHHPQGIIPQLAVNCDCRKPKPGLLFAASEENQIDLSNSVFLGDSATDVQAGKAAGCPTIIYLHQQNLPEKVAAAKSAPADYQITSLADCLSILEKIFLKQ